MFRDGILVCFVGCHIHNTDMGGAVPASLSRTLTEVHQEGIRIPPMLLIRDGVIDDKLLQILNINVRAPEQNRGDLNAQIAALNTGERSVHEIIDRFGVADFMEGAERILAYGEQQSRALIRDIPDGEYFFSEYADEDSVGGYPCRIAITLRVQGDELEMDFTGSDPQVASSLNMPTGGDPRHPIITIGLIYVLHTLNPDNVLNCGTFRAILPTGSVVNPLAPAAVGMRSLMAAVVQACTFGAFSQALPQLLPACPAGGSTLLNVKTATRDGRQVLASIGPCGGGAGGGPEFDGVEACGANNAFLKNSPMEINEAEVPIEIVRYGLVPDTGGAGMNRGGNRARPLKGGICCEAVIRVTFRSGDSGSGSVMNLWPQSLHSGHRATGRQRQQWVESGHSCRVTRKVPSCSGIRLADYVRMQAAAGGVQLSGPREAPKRKCTFRRALAMDITAPRYRPASSCARRAKATTRPANSRRGQCLCLFPPRPRKTFIVVPPHFWSYTMATVRRPRTSSLGCAGVQIVAV